MKLRLPFVWRSTLDAVQKLRQQEEAHFRHDIERAQRNHSADLDHHYLEMRKLENQLAATEASLKRVARVAAGEHPEYALPVPRFEFRSELQYDIRMACKVFRLAANQHGITFAISDLDSLAWGRERAAMIAARLGKQLGEAAEDYTFKALTAEMK